MSVRIGLPRVRYSCETNYSNRPGYHDVQYELIMMSNQNLLADDSVREAVMRFSSDVYYLEAFAADYIHRLSECVVLADSNSEESHAACRSSPSLDSEVSSSGNYFPSYVISICSKNVRDARRAFW